MTIEKRHFAITNLEVRTQDDENPTPRLTGYASVFNADSHDLGGFIERIAPSAFERSLQAVNDGDLNVHALWSHDQSQPLGSTRGGKLSLTQDESGLKFDLDVSRMTPAQLDAARDGDLQMSFGFRVVQDAWTKRDDGLAQRTVTDLELLEISPVVFPAYPDTSAAVRSLKAWEDNTVEDIEEKIEEIATDTAHTDEFNGLRIRLMKRWLDQRYPPTE